MNERTNNKVSSFSMLGASNHSSRERAENDYYATPPVAVSLLLDKLNKYNINLHKAEFILEPACGEGHISETLKAYGFNVLSSDIIPRGYSENIEDFLTTTRKDLNANIITNPPYKFAKEFVERAIETVQENNYVIMFLKLTFLESAKRYELFQKYPPKYIFVFSERISCPINGDFENNNYIGGSVCYAWFVWEKGYKGMPMVDWIKLYK